MNRLLLSLSLCFTAPAAIAQNCFDGDFGVVIAQNSLSFQDWVSPMLTIGFAFPVAGTTYTNIHVSDHGLAFLSNAGVPVPPASQSSVLYTPTTANFAGGSPKVCALYTDVIYVPLTKIWFKSSPTKCTITWIDVQNFGITSIWFSFQMTLFPSGDVRVVYGPGCTNNSLFGGVSANGIVGISAGGGVTLPPAVDLSAGGATAATTIFELWTTPNSFDMANNTLLLTATPPGGSAGYVYANLGPRNNCAAAPIIGTHCGMFLEALGLPSLGNSDFGLGLLVPGAPPQAFVAIGSVLLAPPGIDLTSIGMPGCHAYTNMDIGMFAVAIAQPSGRGTFAMPIPNDPLLLNAHLSAQAVSLGNTPLGLVASFAVDVAIGFGY
jgi:hypothetical protein